jgi:excinuclease ABC subunit B
MFKLKSDYAPTGDQPQAIAALSASFLAGNKHQTLLGVTGSGKTFTMANLIVARDRPTFIIFHNKPIALAPSPPPSPPVSASYSRTANGRASSSA